MWTAKVIGKSKGGGRIVLKVEFTNGSESFQEEYIASSGSNSEWLKNLVRARVGALTSMYQFVDSIVVNDDVDASPPAPPTQAEQELSTFLSKYNRWLSVKRAIDTGVLTGNEAPVQNLLNEVKTLFKPAYLQHM